MIINHPLQKYSKEIRKDETGLGKWLWFNLEENNVINTTIISTHFQCKPRKLSLLSIYSQHMRCWKLQRITVCAKEKLELIH